MTQESKRYLLYVEVDLNQLRETCSEDFGSESCDWREMILHESQWLQQSGLLVTEVQEVEENE